MRYPFAGVLLLGLLLSIGCGGASSKEDLERRSLQDVYDEAQKLSVDGLERQAAAYRDAIRSQQGEMEQLRQQRNSLPYDQRNGDQAQKLDEEMKDLGTSIKNLRDRHRIYIERLQQKGVPTDEYVI